NASLGKRPVGEEDALGSPASGTSFAAVADPLGITKYTNAPPPTAPSRSATSAAFTKTAVLIATAGASSLGVVIACATFRPDPRTAIRCRGFVVRKPA